MLSFEQTAALQEYAVSLASRLPGDWDRLVVYKEFSRQNGELVGAQVVVWFRGNDLIKNYYAPAEAEFAARSFFELSERSGNAWNGMRFEMRRNGTYATRFYYDGFPLMDGVHNTALDRLYNDGTDRSTPY